MVEVFDEGDQKKDAVLIGTGSLEMNKKYLPEIEAEMDGVVPININLAWKNPETRKLEPAGSVTLDLVFIHSPELHLKSAMMITKTWYVRIPSAQRQCSESMGTFQSYATLTFTRNAGRPGTLSLQCWGWSCFRWSYLLRTTNAYTSFRMLSVNLPLVLG
jgi:hypothetical protein